MLKLTKNERIVTAFAEYVSGPGWSNQPIWVIVRGNDGALREECIQPDQQTADMHTLFSVSAAAHRSMYAAVVGALSKPRKRVKGE